MLLIYTKVKRVLPHHPVLPACVYVASHIKSPGVIEHKGNPGVIIAGVDPALPNADYDRITDLFHSAGINFTLKPDAGEEIRSKFLFIAAFGLISARYNKPIGEILADGALRKETENLLLEYASMLFRADEKVFRIERAIERAKAFPYTTRTSLQLDVHGGKGPHRNELDLYLRPLIQAGVFDDSLARRLAAEIRNRVSHKSHQ